MGYLPSMAREYHRTCKHCGKEWYAPIKRPPPAIGIVGERLNASGASMRGGFGALGGGARAQGRAAELQQQRDTVLAMRRCPDCGSGSYSEEKVRV